MFVKICCSQTKGKSLKNATERYTLWGSDITIKQYQNTLILKKIRLVLCKTLFISRNEKLNLKHPASWKIKEDEFQVALYFSKA